VNVTTSQLSRYTSSLFHWSRR